MFLECRKWSELLTGGDFVKKKLIIGIVVVILLISLLPFPQHIERTYYGVNTGNGEKVDIALDMKYLRYLFLNDKIYGTITVKTETETLTYGEYLHYSGQTPSVNNANDRAHDFSGWYYNENIYMKEYENGAVSEMPVGFEPLLVHISSDFNNILILHKTSGKIETQEDRRYIGSIEQNQLEDTKEYFSGYYD